MRHLALLACLPLLACGSHSSLEDLDAPFGGFDFSVEEPLFGSPHREQFVSAGENTLPQAVGVEAPVTARSWAAWAAWGHLLATRDDPAWTDWTGTLSVDQGTLSLERTLAFDREDRVLAPPDDATVAFVSHTRPHFDGLVARVTSTSENPTLTLDTAAVTLPVGAGNVPVRADATVPGSTVRAILLTVPLVDGAPCSHVVMTGRWRAVEDPRALARGLQGRVVGRLFTAEGTLVGHWRAVTGTRSDGTHVVFGKLIDVDGHALARLDGTQQDDMLDVRLSDAADVELGRVQVALERADSTRAFLLAAPALARCPAAP